MEPDAVPACAGVAPVWSGHQPGLWHPGILTKLLLADALSGAAGGPPAVWLVVDHDEAEPLSFGVPTRRGDRLGSARVRLGRERPGVPPGCREPAPPPELGSAWPADAALPPGRLEAALGSLPREEARPAEHATRLMLALAGPLLIRPPELVFSSRLHAHPVLGPAFRRLVRRLLGDAVSAVSSLNAAAARHPAAGVASLSSHPFLVELPLWLLAENQPRGRVYADLADAEPWLVDAAGERLDPESAWLAPRALLMTALVRSEPGACGRFLHGTGGAAYDRITDDWWAAWSPDRPLAPIAAATADLRLGLDAPVASPADLARARWRAHHLPHNLDRVPEVAAGHGDLVEEKRLLLASMDDDRDGARRAAAFRRIHRINDALADAHHALLDAAEREVATAAAGVANRRATRRRDWPFFLYAEEALAKLRREAAARVR
ncbi:hypothetical protein HNQ78_000125 [Phycisphaera mikurensis]|nr:hypothetical protein [Phycisphaera mikurensis]